MKLAFAFVLGTGLLVCTPAQATEIIVPSGGSLANAIARAVPGDEIVLDAGGIYTGDVLLPEKGGPITIRSSAVLPDRRIGPADRALLPSLGSGSSMAPIRITGSHWRLVGLAFRANTNGEGNIIEISGGAADIVIDRVLIEGGAQGQKRGVAMNGGGAVTVTRSHMANMWKAGQDSQALAAWDGPGPFTIRDNYLEAASENILFGGADSTSEARMPADILVEGNHLTKNPAWKGAYGYVVKNLFELKAARRAVIRDNLMEGNWADGQSGWAVVVTPRNQDGGAPWTAIEDVLFERNIVRNTVGGINITGRDDNGVSQQTRRLTFRHNLFITDHAWMQAGAEIGELTLDHNTVLNGSTLIKLWIAPIRESGGYLRTAEYAIDRLVVVNSLMQHGPDGYGIWGEASGIGTTALAYHVRTYDVRRNVIAGENGWGLPYPADTDQPAYATHLAQFADATYGLVEGSVYRGAALDGADLGWSVSLSLPAVEPPPTEPVPPTEPPPPPPPADPLPSPWTSQDVGAVGLAGQATLVDGAISVRASGADVWGTADGMHFAWQSVNGDVDVVARVSSVDFVHAWTKAGVMIRETLAADSAQAFMLVSAGKGLAFQRRVATAGLSTHTAGTLGTAPSWVKLERRGATISAFESGDGVTWTLVGSDTFAMAANVYVGLALSSHDNTALAGATFDAVSVTPILPPSPIVEEPVSPPPPPPPAVDVAIETSALPEGVRRRSYTAALVARDASGPVTWAVGAGKLPPGCSLDAANGAIIGTPQKAGTYGFTVTVTDGRTTASRALSIVVRPN